jgi:hypothetical protein
MTPAIAEAIVRRRQGDDQLAGTADDRHFHEVAGLLALDVVDRATLARIEPWLTVVPTAFRVIATGRVESGQGTTSVYRQLAIIDRTARPVRIQYWWRLS